MKNVVVTGCTRGIGRQIAIDLAKEGYSVIGIYRASVSEAKTLEKDFGITTYQCDLSCAFSTADLCGLSERRFAYWLHRLEAEGQHGYDRAGR